MGEISCVQKRLMEHFKEALDDCCREEDASVKMPSMTVADGARCEQSVDVAEREKRDMLQF